MLINQSSRKGIFGQPDGNFSLIARQNDSIVISVKGYIKKSFVVISSKNCKMEIKVALQPVIQNQKEVIVKPIKSIQQIKEERSNLIKKETKITSGAEVLKAQLQQFTNDFQKK